MWYFILSVNNALHVSKLENLVRHIFLSHTYTHLVRHFLRRSSSNIWHFDIEHFARFFSVLCKPTECLRRFVQCYKRLVRILNESKVKTETTNFNGRFSDFSTVHRMHSPIFNELNTLCLFWMLSSLILSFFYLVREILLKLRIEKEAIGNFFSQKNARSNDDEAPTCVPEQRNPPKSWSCSSPLNTTNEVSSKLESGKLEQRYHKCRISCYQWSVCTARLICTGIIRWPTFKYIFNRKSLSIEMHICIDGAQNKCTLNWKAEMNSIFK